MNRLLLAAVAVIALCASAHGTELQLKSCRGLISTVKEYGNGVYYLGCGDIGKALSELRSLYPRHTISFASYDSIDGNTSGYYVILNPPAQ